MNAPSGSSNGRGCLNAPLGRADISWMPERRALSGPIYRAIAGAIGDAIRSGGLQPGDRLPPHRALAAAMGIDITTVTRAYAEAQRQGLVEATIGSGTFVRAEAPVLGQASERGIIDLTMNLPPSLPDFPLGRRHAGHAVAAAAPAGCEHADVVSLGCGHQRGPRRRRHLAASRASAASTLSTCW